MVRPKNKKPEYYDNLKEEYEEFILINELWAISSVVEAINTMAICLLQVEEIDVCQQGGKEGVPKNLNIGVIVLACRTNAMWDILMATEE